MSNVTTRRKPRGKENTKKEAPRSPLLVHIERDLRAISYFSGKKRENLLPLVAEASVALDSSSLLLEECHTELLMEIREVVKDLSEKKEPLKILEGLVFSVHGIRSIVAFLSGSRIDLAVKLLCFLITNAARLYDIDERKCDKAYALGLAAIQAMSTLLRKADYSVAFGTKIMTFAAPHHDICITPVKSHNSSPYSSMPGKELATVVVKSTLSVVQMLVRIWGHTGLWKGVSKNMMRESLNDPLQLATTLAQDGFQAWALVLEPSTLAAHAKNLFRVFWEASSIVEATDARGCLKVRSLALATSLLADQELEDDALWELREKLWDLACVSAWKAATIYTNKSKDNEDQIEVLRDYYSATGSALDRFATLGGPSLAYLEFCYRRASCTPGRPTPCHSNNCLFQHLSFVYCHASCEDCEFDAIAAAIGCGVVSKRTVAPDNGSNSALNSSTAQSIISRARGALLNSKDGASLKDADTVSLFKLFSDLSLHSMAYRYVFDNQARQAVNGDVMETICSLLATCIGPFAAKIVRRKGAVSGDILSRAGEVLIESYVRAIFAMNTIDCDAKTGRCAAWMSTFADAVSECTRGLQSTAVDKAARSMSLIGRQHMKDDRPGASLLPLICAVRFAHLHAKLSQRGVDSTPLSSYWSTLASAYSAADRRDEALVCYISALSCACTENCEDIRNESDEDLVTDLLEAICLQSDGLLPVKETDGSDALNQSLAKYNRLARRGIRHVSLAEPVIIEGSVRSLTASSLIDILADDRLVATAISEKCNISFTIECLAQVLLASSIHPHEKLLSKPVVLIEKTKALVVTMNHLGSIIRDSSEMKGFACFRRFAAVIKSFLAKALAGDEQGSLLCRGAASVAASVSILSENQVAECCQLRVTKHVDSHETLSAALRFAKDAEVSVAQCSSSKWALAQGALAIGTLTLVTSLTCMLDERLSVRDGLERVLQRTDVLLADSVEAGGREQFARRMLDALRRRFTCRLMFEGEEFLSTLYSMTTEGSTQSAAAFLDAVFSARDDAAVPEALADLPDLDIEMIEQSLLMNATEICLIESTLTGMERLLDSTDDEHNLLPGAWLCEAFCWVAGLFYEQDGRLVQSIAAYQRCIKFCKRTIALAGRFPSSTVSFRLDVHEIILRSEARISTCLHRCAIGNLYLGNHRKAQAYAASAVTLVCEESFTGGKMPVREVLDSITTSHSSSAAKSKALRLLVLVKALSSPLHETLAAFDELTIDSFVRTVEQASLPQSTESFDRFMNLLVAEELFRHQLLSDYREGGSSIPLDAARQNFRNEVLDTTLASEVDHEIALSRSVDAHVEVSQARLELAKRKNLSENALDGALQVNTHISHVFTRYDRAFSLYMLGTNALLSLQRKDTLRKLWSNKVGGEDRAAITSAGNYFDQALDLLGDSCCDLSRNSRRQLALLAGPDWGVPLHPDSSSMHLLSSIGRSSNRRALELTGDPTGAHGLFHRVGSSRDDKEVCHELEKRLSSMPITWNLVSMTICPMGELMIGVVERREGETICRTTCVVPEVNNVGEYAWTGFDSIIRPLDQIIVESDACLQSSSGGGESGDRKAWWEERSRQDQALQSHLERVDEMILSGKRTAALFDAGQHPTRCRSNLASRFDDAASAPARDRDSYSQREHLVDCTLLILDESLSRFPVEGLSVLKGRTVCRQPSLGHLVSSLVSSNGNEVRIEPAATNYILDPESNLQQTRERLEPFLDECSGKTGGRWSGIVGESPPAEFFVRGITSDHSLFLYFGHGGGQQFFSRKDVENAVSSGSDAARCEASIVLMGCSSGRLESVNHRGTLDAQWLPMIFEPEGIALTYLNCGAPVVVSNLWDVTDRDIDRFAMTMLNQFLDDDSSVSLADCLRSARGVCKMKHINGLAPVYYGLPAILREG